MTDLYQEGADLVAYHQQRRAKALDAIRRTREIVADLPDGLSPEARVEFRRWAWDETKRIAYRAPVRLRSRRDMLRFARRIRQGVRRVKRDTNWDALWCGEQDGLLAQLDGHWRVADALRAYARVSR